MSKYYILYNPLAGNGTCQENTKTLEGTHENSVMCDMTEIEDYAALLSQLDEDDSIVICGGDGTLNRFINETGDFTIKNKVYYYAVGSGNDFIRDLGKTRGTNPDFEINEYIKDLPKVMVNGVEHRFINGIGYGIDGYCCEVGDELRKTSDKPINYAGIAIKGLLFHYKPTNAKVTVDGVTKTYEKVWLAPTMNGRFYGGGMMPTPAQDRIGKDKSLSVMVLHGSGKIKTLAVFPSIFKGKHVERKEMVEVLTGHEITVEFDRPTALQIDGETILGVTSYTAKSAV